MEKTTTQSEEDSQAHLQQVGIIDALPVPLAERQPYDSQAIQVKGTPLSETIIEERR